MMYLVLFCIDTVRTRGFIVRIVTITSYVPTFLVPILSYSNHYYWIFFPLKKLCKLWQICVGGASRNRPFWHKIYVSENSQKLSQFYAESKLSIK